MGHFDINPSRFMGMDALATPVPIQCTSRMSIFRPQYQSLRLHLLTLNGPAWMLVYVRGQKDYSMELNQYKGLQNLLSYETIKLCPLMAEK